MSRRKGEITARMNERNCPHIVQLPLPSGGFRSKSDDILAFHRERSIKPRRGRGWLDDEQYYVRFCFGDPAHADAFRERFGGERLTTPPPRGPPSAASGPRMRLRTFLTSSRQLPAYARGWPVAASRAPKPLSRLEILAIISMCGLLFIVAFRDGNLLWAIPAMTLFSLTGMALLSALFFKPEEGSALAVP